MFSAWLIGFEDEPDRCGEICLVEIFGAGIDDGTAVVGCGIHAFRDPRLTEDFVALPRRFDVAAEHTYAVDWQPDSVRFLIDGGLAHVSDQSPGYPMRLELAVFDFPDGSDPGTTGAFTVTSVRYRRT